MLMFFHFRVATAAINIPLGRYAITITHIKSYNVGIPRRNLRGTNINHYNSGLRGHLNWD